MEGGLRLENRVRTDVGEVAYGVFGEGSPVVLVHGTPSRSHIWRGVVSRLAERHAVYVYDLPGFGKSERHEGQDISIAAQGRVLAGLVERWGLKEPAVAGHDIGGGIVLRAHLLEGTSFRKISLLDAVVLTPWGTPALRHVREHLGAYRTMPTEVFEAYVAARLEGTTSRKMDREVSEAYLSQWRGPEGQAAYLRKDEALIERDTAEVERLLGDVRAPVLVVWGGEDAWLHPSQAEALVRKIPGAELRFVAGAGHFVMEDAPGRVAEILAGFFAEIPPGANP
ncbi:alpha/beta fold hydrolase [Rubrobacter tropicus]|uniref:Alpha/beta fold hydrolase n=1 Tax=Rubrobacter tropicus TaxID=2653851 RepID=A0A6G8Q4Y8_9ACTN|nr:alpha/beta fold hydrolase [Rubrobacter tropicus]